MSEIYKNILFSQSEYKEQLEYWVKNLEEDFSMSDFPFTKSKICTCKSTYSNVVSTLSKELNDKVKGITNGESFTTYMLLVAALKVYIYKYIENSSVSIATPIFNGDEEDLYNDLLILKDEVEGEKTFKELILQVKDTVVNAYENQEYPIEMIFKNLEIDEKVNELIHVGVALEGLQDSRKLLENKFAMNFIFKKNDDNMEVELSYVQGVISEKQANNYINKYLFILEQCVNDINIEINNISLIEESEKSKILDEFNNIASRETNLETIGKMFELATESYADKIAVVANKGEKISYKDLNEKSNQLARVLSDKGINKDDIVGISLEPSIELVITVLAVIKLGATYVPVEPTIPKDRYEYIINDSKLKTLIAKKNVEYEFNIDDKVMFLDDMLKDIDSKDKSNVENDVDLDHSMYIIYTSGTTGVPKGVKIKHRSIANYMNWFKKAAKLSSDDKVVLISSFSFDLGYTAFYSSILNGCELHLLKKEEYTDPSNLLDYIMSNKITYAKMTPSLFKIISSAELFKNGQGFKSMRLVVLGGEMINLSDVEEMHKVYPDVSVLNHYGPTETTIGVIAHEIDFNNFEEYKKVPVIGKPIDNVQVYILDKTKKMLPIGVPGEIYISGECLAEGYVNNEKLTNEKFIQNPFKENELMYCTGDKGLFTEDGEIDFLGRADNQVKIRGYRVEPEEINKVLRQYKDVEDCLVVVKEDQDKNKFICSYIVSEEYSVKELRDFLKNQLPDYMIPSYFVNIPQIPLTNNGKINYKALPAPSEIIDTGVEYIEARNDIERAMVEAWKDVLNVKKVGVLDDFFVLGGDSIKAIQVSTRLRNAGIEFNLKDLMEYPTINEVARKASYVDKNQEEKEEGLTCDRLSEEEIAYLKNKYESEERSLEIEDISDVIPMEEVMFNRTTYVEGVSPYIHYRKFTINNEINLKYLNKTFNILIDKYDVLRSVYDNTTSAGLVRIIYKHMPSEIYYEDKSNLSPEEAENYFQDFVTKEAERGFEIEKENLTRVSIIKTGDNRYRGIWSNHHLILDGWSKIILVREFLQYLKKVKAGEQFEVERGIPFTKYVKWYKQQDLKETYKYFEDMLDGYDVKQMMPYSAEAALDEIYNQGNYNLILNEEVTSGLLRIAKARKTTLSTILRGAWTVLLQRLNDVDDVVFGSIVSGRVSSIANMEGRVGSHINMIPVRVKCSENKTFEECMELIQTQFIASERYAYFSLDAYEESAYKDLLDTMLIVENYPIEDAMKGIYQGRSVVSDVEIFDQTHCNFNIFVTPFETTLLKFSYNNRRYSDELVEKIAMCLNQIINQILENPKVKIKDFQVDINSVLDMPLLKEPEYVY